MKTNFIDRPEAALRKECRSASIRFSGVFNEHFQTVETLVDLGQRGRVAPADKARSRKRGARYGRNQALFQEQLREVLGGLDDLAVHGLADKAVMSS